MAEVLERAGQQGPPDRVAKQGGLGAPGFQRRHELLEEEPEAPPLTRITLLVHAAVRAAPEFAYPILIEISRP